MCARGGQAPRPDGTGDASDGGQRYMPATRAREPSILASLALWALIVRRGPFGVQAADRPIAVSGDDFQPVSCMGPILDRRLEERLGLIGLKTRCRAARMAPNLNQRARNTGPGRLLPTIVVAGRPFARGTTRKQPPMPERLSFPLSFLQSPVPAATICGDRVGGRRERPLAEDVSPCVR